MQYVKIKYCYMYTYKLQENNCVQKNIFFIGKQKFFFIGKKRKTKLFY